MIKRFLTYGIILLFVCMSINPSIAFDNVKKSTIPVSDGNWLYVGGSGPNNYTKIQDAIDNASDGDTVFVYDDSSPYIENVEINKELSLIGENQNSTIIDGGGISYVILVRSNYVEICDFTIQNCINAYDFAGIYIQSADSCCISNNTILNSSEWPHIVSDGIQILSGNDNIIDGNKIVHTWDGISLYYSNNNMITNNTFIDHIHGVFIYGNNHDNTIQYNIFEQSDNNAILIDIKPEMHIERLQIHNNTMNGNYSPISGGFEAITSYTNCDNISIIGNEINEFGTAIWIGGNKGIISNNVIDNCKRAVILREESISLNISHNTFRKGDIGINLGGSNHKVSYNILQKFEIGVYTSGTNNIVWRNKFEENKGGFHVILRFDTGKVMQNNFINNTRDILFYQLLPFRRHRPLNPIFTNNYYDSWDSDGPQKIIGGAVVFAIPFILPIFPYFFLIPISIPWLYFDWRPAKEPYDITT